MIMARKQIEVGKRETPKQTCFRCKEDFPLKEFYKISSPSYPEHIPWCKNCTREMLLTIIEQYGGDKELGVLAFCRMLDIPFLYDKITPIIDDIDNFLGKYIQLLSVMKKAKRKTNSFGDSTHFTEQDILKLRHVNKVISGDTQTDCEDFEITKDMKALWKNPLYDDNKLYYSILWEHYQHLISSQPDATPSQKLHFPKLAELHLQGEILGWESKWDEYKKLQDMYLARFTAAGLSLKNQPKKEDVSVGICELIQGMENSGEFIEPWDSVVEYNHRRDLVSKFELDTINVARKNAGLECIDELPRYVTARGTTPHERFSDDEIALSERIDREQNLENILNTDDEESE